MATQTDREQLSGVKDDYRYGFHDEASSVYQTPRGLDHSVIDAISDQKNEPDWMRQFRHEALDIFLSKPMPTWGADLSGIDFDEIIYYLSPMDKTDKSGKSQALYLECGASPAEDVFVLFVAVAPLADLEAMLNNVTDLMSGLEF